MRICRRVIIASFYGAAIAFAAPAAAFEDSMRQGSPSALRSETRSDQKGEMRSDVKSRTDRKGGGYSDAQEALQAGIETYRSGDPRNSVEALTYAAQGGAALAQWKLGKMYAAGDGVAADDYKAYQYFLEIVQNYDEDSTPRRVMPFVSSAFVAVGSYSLKGIPDSKLKPDPRRALVMFRYAATNFGDVNAQYNIARIYLDGAGVEKDTRQAARWLRLATEKGHAPSQALLGHLLFTGADGVSRQRAQGLMFLTLARESAIDSATDGWIVDTYEKDMAAASDEDRQAALAYLEAYLKKR